MTSIPMGYNPPQGQNMLQQLGQYMQMQQMANQNQLFQQEMAGRQALPGIISQSIDPNTGLPDVGLAAKAIAANPQAGFVGSQYLSQIPAMAERAAQTAKTQQETLAARTNAVGNFFNAAAGVPVDQNLVPALRALSGVYFNGNPQAYAMANAYLDKAEGMSPDQAKALLTQVHLQSIPAGDAINAMKGENMQMDLGPVKQVLNVNPVLGTTQAMTPALAVGVNPNTMPTSLPIGKGEGNQIVGPMGNSVPAGSVVPGAGMPFGGSSNMLTGGGGAGPMPGPNLLIPQVPGTTLGNRPAPVGQEAPKVNPASTPAPGTNSGDGLVYGLANRNAPNYGGTPGIEGPPKTTLANVQKNAEEYSKFAADTLENVGQLSALTSKLTAAYDVVDTLAKHPNGMGGLTAEKTALAQQLQGLGVPASVTEQFLTNGQPLSQYQFLSAIANSIGISNLAEMAKGTGRILLPELETELKQTSINQNPDAFKAILQNWMEGAQQKFNDVHAIMKYEEEKGGPSVPGSMQGFYMTRNKMYQTPDTPLGPAGHIVVPGSGGITGQPNAPVIPEVSAPPPGAAHVRMSPSNKVTYYLDTNGNVLGKTTAAGGQ